jgi:hypothetical protein
VESGFHWRFCSTNRQWKHPISTGGCVKITASGNRFPLAVPKPGPPHFFYWRAITETASDNLWVPQAMSSFLLVGRLDLANPKTHLAKGHQTLGVLLTTAIDFDLCTLALRTELSLFALKTLSLTVELGQFVLLRHGMGRLSHEAAPPPAQRIPISPPCPRSHEQVLRKPSDQLKRRQKAINKE